jgi:hypothetical protein
VVGYNDMEERSDLKGLIKIIKGLSFQFEGQHSKTRGLVIAHKRFQYLNQTRDMTDARFLEKFLTSVVVLEQYGGTKVLLLTRLTQQATPYWPLWKKPSNHLTLQGASL